MDSLKSYKMTKLYEQNLPKNKKDTVIKLFRKDKQMLTKNDISHILKEFNKKNKRGNVQMIIRGRKPIGMTTFKGLEYDFIDWENEYWGNVESGNVECFYLEITLRK